MFQGAPLNNVKYSFNILEPAWLQLDGKWYSVAFSPLRNIFGVKHFLHVLKKRLLMAEEE